MLHHGLFPFLSSFRFTPINLSPSASAFGPLQGPFGMLKSKHVWRQHCVSVCCRFCSEKMCMYVFVERNRSDSAVNVNNTLLCSEINLRFEWRSNFLHSDTLCRSVHFGASSNMSRQKTHSNLSQQPRSVAQPHHAVVNRSRISDFLLTSQRNTSVSWRKVGHFVKSWPVLESNPTLWERFSQNGRFSILLALLWKVTLKLCTAQQKCIDHCTDQESHWTSETSKSNVKEKHIHAHQPAYLKCTDCFRKCWQMTEWDELGFVSRTEFVWHNVDRWRAPHRPIDFRLKTPGKKIFDLIFLQTFDHSSVWKDCEELCVPLSCGENLWQMLCGNDNLEVTGVTRRSLHEAQFTWISSVLSTFLKQIDCSEKGIGRILCSGHPS